MDFVKRSVFIIALSLFMIGCSQPEDAVSEEVVDAVEEIDYEEVAEVVEVPEEEETEIEVYKELSNMMNASSIEKTETFEGSNGQSVVFEVLVDGMVKFITENSGSSNFIVQVEDGDTGDRLGSVANHIGDFSSHQFLYLPEGEYILQVKSDGEWKIDIEQPFIHEVIEEKEFTGNGNMTIGPLTSGASRIEFLGDHSGDGNFAVRLLNVFGDQQALVFNEIGNYEGNYITTIDPDTIFFLDVTANGDWDIEIVD